MKPGIFETPRKAVVCLLGAVMASAVAIAAMMLTFEAIYYVSQWIRAMIG